MREIKAEAKALGAAVASALFMAVDMTKQKGCARRSRTLSGRR